MSESPIDHGPDRASDLRTEIVKILGYSEWHQVHNPAAKIAVLHADLIAKLVERHQAEAAQAIHELRSALTAAAVEIHFTHRGRAISMMECPETRCRDWCALLDRTSSGEIQRAREGT